MTQTLRRERKQKFFNILENYYQDNPPTEDARKHNLHVAELLADASISREENATNEEAGEYNTELFRGDWRDYPEHLWGIAEALRDTWKFTLPEKPKKKSNKGKYALYVQAMEAIKQSCGEFGADVLVKVYVEWKSQFKNGIAPYTVAQPTSLINVCSGKARDLRDGMEKKSSLFETLT